MENNGKQRICDALMVLADNRPVTEIPISALVQKAGVSRSTFYYHFNSTEAVLDYMMRDFCRRYLDALIIPFGESSVKLGETRLNALEKDVCRYIAKSAPYVHFFLTEPNYRVFYRIFSDCYREYCAKHRIIQTFPDGHTETLRHGVFYDYYMHTFCHQLFAYLECWAERNFSEKEEDFINIYNTLTSTVITFEGK